jgi:hypothetical protein
VLVVFLAPAESATGQSEDDAIEREMTSIPGLSTGILSATQGAYAKAQLVLDITQGARVSNSAYKPADPPPLSLPISARAGGQTTSARTDVGAEAGANVPAGARGWPKEKTPVPAPSQVREWGAVLARAHGAPQLLEPGSLAAHVPGGGAYVPAAGVDSVDGVVAADRGGRVASVWIDPLGTLPSIARLLTHRRLVVADLPAGAEGYVELRALAATRPTRELLIAIQRTTDDLNVPGFDPAGRELLWTAVGGVGPGGDTLTSQTTNERGIVAAIDIAPTILDHLGLPIPAAMRGRAIHTDGRLDSEGLRALKSRLGVLASRRSLSARASAACVARGPCGSARLRCCGRRSPPSYRRRSSRGVPRSSR